MNKGYRYSYEFKQEAASQVTIHGYAAIGTEHGKKQSGLYFIHWDVLQSKTQARAQSAGVTKELWKAVFDECKKCLRKSVHYHNGADNLSYGLHQDSLRQTNVTSVSGAFDFSFLGVQGGSHLVGVYGRIPSGQLVSSGTCTDTITLALTF